MDLGQFSRRIKTIANNLEVNVDREVIKVAGLAQQVVVTSTPVDTGRARANWQASLDSPITFPIDDEDPGGGATVALNDSVISARKSNQTIYISNNLDYIKALNEGWSAQAPAGFVQKAVQAAISYIKSVRVIF